MQLFDCTGAGDIGAEQRETRRQHDNYMKSHMELDETNILLSSLGLADLLDTY